MGIMIHFVITEEVNKRLLNVNITERFLKYCGANNMRKNTILQDLSMEENWPINSVMFWKLKFSSQIKCQSDL